jgi:hypothetical protein
MKKRLFFLTLTTAFCTSLVFLASCRKKEKEDTDTDGAKDHALVETYSNDIMNMGHQASYPSGLSTYKNGNDSPDEIYAGCATITRDTLNAADADTLTIDFGTSGCTGGDGRVRKGKVIYTYLAGMHYRDSANVITVKTQNYSVDGNQVNVVNKTITNKGHITNGKLTWTISANINVVKTDGKTISWSTNKTKVLLAGEQPNNLPVNWPQAQVAIYGSASGTKADGESFNVNINQSTWVVRDFSCTSARKYFVSGIIEYTPGSRPTRYINFGTGACDNLATVTINGNVYNITLR